MMWKRFQPRRLNVRRGLRASHLIERHTSNDLSAPTSDGPEKRGMQRPSDLGGGCAPPAATSLRLTPTDGYRQNSHLLAPFCTFLFVTVVQNFNDALLDGGIEIDLVEDQFPLGKRPR
jgi:hypothetical protein